jgi:acetate kinase
VARLSILVVNAGSTSLKLHLVEADERSTAVESLEAIKPARVEAVGHRVVHGGSRFRDPVLIDPAVRAQILELEALAPLHNAPALVGITQAMQRFPDVPQVAVFDTGFHATIPDEAAVYALPRLWREEWGIRRYGFHGISVAWCAQRAPLLLGRPVEGLRLVVCHLGGGSSVTAVRDGDSIDTTMGFSPLEGLPMSTRSGSVDPGALVYLLRERGLTPDTLEHALNIESGLKGLAGGSGDMIEVEQNAAAGNPDAKRALDVFVHRLAAAVAAMTASLGGLDALVFTAGIGEHSARVRAHLCARLGFLGIELDAQRNSELESHRQTELDSRSDRTVEPDRDIAAVGSPARVLVVRAREELVVARAVRALTASTDSKPEQGWTASVTGPGRDHRS